MIRFQTALNFTTAYNNNDNNNKVFYAPRYGDVHDTEGLEKSIGNKLQRGNVRIYRQSILRVSRKNGGSLRGKTRHGNPSKYFARIWKNRDGDINTENAIIIIFAFPYLRVPVSESRERFRVLTKTKLFFARHFIDEIFNYR